MKSVTEILISIKINNQMHDCVDNESDTNMNKKKCVVCVKEAVQHHHNKTHKTCIKRSTYNL